MGNICGSDVARLPLSSMTSQYRRTIEDFEILRLLGKGGFGKVLLVKLRTSGQLFALKEVKKQKLKLLNHQSQALTERTILKDIESPFVVKLHYAFQNNSKLFMIIDYMPGGSLFNLMQVYGCFSEPQARFILAEVILGLETLHRNSIIYRDLKPENILMDQAGHIKLSDFNLSKINQDECYSFVGTPEYLAPEILKKESFTFAVDFWTVGVLLYEMLGGITPFKAKNRNLIFDKVLNQEVRFKNWMSPNARNLIQGLLAKDPNQRINDWGEIKRHSLFDQFSWEDAELKIIPPLVSPPPEGKLFTLADNSHSDSHSIERYENFTYIGDSDTDPS